MSAESWQSLADTLKKALAESPHLRQAARQVAAWLLESVQRAELAPGSMTETKPASEPPRSEPRPLEANVPDSPVRPPAPAPEVRQARSGLVEGPGAAIPRIPTVVPVPLRPVPAGIKPPIESAIPAWLDPAPLRRVIESARLKAEACRVALKKLELTEGDTPVPAEISKRMEYLAEEVRKPGRRPLWMLGPTPIGRPPLDRARLEVFLGGFENLAGAASLCVQFLEHAPGEVPPEEALTMLAEAQSGLSVAVEQYNAREHDPDQADVFRWVRELSEASRIFFPRFLSLAARADPSRHAWLALRIGAMEQSMADRWQDQKLRQATYKKIAYHVDQLSKHVGDAEAVGHDWRVIRRAVEDLAGTGVPMSARQLQDLLEPAAGAMPDEFEPGTKLAEVIRNLDERLAAREAAVGAAAATDKPGVVTGEIMRAAELLRGKRVLLIGGARRPLSAAALTDALGLGDLKWIPPRPSQSIADIEPEIARSETDIVLLAVRWSTHSFEGIRNLCQRHNKALVRLPAGYLPSHVAHQVVSQIGDQLAAARAAQPAE